MSFSNTPRKTPRTSTSDRERGSTRRDGRQVYMSPQGILSLPSMPPPPPPRVEEPASPPLTTERRVTFSDNEGGSSRLSVRAAEFRPSSNLPGPPTTPRTNAVLARGKGTPIDDLTTVVRGPPSSVRVEREAGSRLLSIPRTQPGALFMQATPIRREPTAVTPAYPDDTAGATTPHTWRTAILAEFEKEVNREDTLAANGRMSLTGDTLSAD
eukprot:gene10136-11993_t